MGVFSGTLSYARYFVEGELPDTSLRETFLERVQQYATPELTVEAEEEEVVGWSCVEGLLDTNFSIEKLFFNEYMIFSLRTDTWRIPSTLLKAYAQEAELKIMQEKEKDKLSKQEKKEIREVVKQQLKRKSLPSISGYDVCWHLDQNIVRFWSLSSKKNEMFVDLFEKTFQVNLVPLSPYTWAEKAEVAEEDLEAMAQLEAQAFSPLSE